MDSLKEKMRNRIIGLLILLIAGIIAVTIIFQKKNEISGINEMHPVAQIHINSEFMKEYELLWGDGYVDAFVRIEDGEYDVIEMAAGIKVRGNCTLEADKLSYAFKFDDNVDVLGMGKGKKWVLLANAYDPTLIRNYIALSVANRLRLDYTSECRFADVWINDIYLGNYLLTEPVQDGEDRVDIHQALGDFLVEYEKTRCDEDETSYILTDDGYRYLIHDPKHASKEQAEYVLDVMNHVESVISEVKETDRKQSVFLSEKQGEYTDIERSLSDDHSSDSGVGGISKLSEVIDIDSFVDYCVFAEFMKSVDMGFSSEYYYYKDGLLHAGPVWDYDMSAGNVNSSYYTHYSNLATTGDSAQGLWIKEQGKLLKELMDIGDFEKLVWDRYMDGEVQSIIEEIYKDQGLIDKVVEEYGESFKRNYYEAGWEEGKQYFAYSGTPLPTFEENVDYLKQWYKRRNEWLLSEIK